MMRASWDTCLGNREAGGCACRPSTTKATKNKDPSLALPHRQALGFTAAKHPGARPTATGEQSHG